MMQRHTTEYVNSESIIDNIDVTNDILTSRGGLSLFVRYLRGISLYPLLERLFAPSARAPKANRSVSSSSKSSAFSWVAQAAIWSPLTVSRKMRASAGPCWEQRRLPVQLLWSQRSWRLLFLSGELSTSGGWKNRLPTWSRVIK